MSALNVVRFRVKPGRENEFVEAHRNIGPFAGMRRAWLVKTGDRTFCMVGVWRDHKSLVDARPAMIATLDKVRGLLEDLGGGLGVTDPVSGEVAVDMAEGRKDRREKRGGGGSREARLTAGAAAGAGAAGAAGAVRRTGAEGKEGKGARDPARRAERRKAKEQRGGKR